MAPAAKKTAATRSTRKKSAARRSSKKTTEFPRRIYAIASPHSIGGVSMFEAGPLIDSSTVANFESDIALVERAVELLEEAGFDVLSANTAMINIAGSRTTFERAFSTELITDEREVVKPGNRVDTATFIDTADTDLSGLIDTSATAFADVLEGVAIEEPYYPMAEAIPPRVASWHLNVPDDVAVALNAARVHRAGRTGAGVTVAMIDTGWYRHPFFAGHGFRARRATLGPGAVNRDDDESGHGTGESANVFAAAPDAELLPVKAATASGALINLTAAFSAAVALDPDVITNSWGGDVRTGPLSAAQQAQAAAIAAAVARGIVVCFSAGNGHFGFPGCHPDVISVGGVFRDTDGSLQASDYASGFVSDVYPGRQVPDVCGLVGMQPGAEYIMLPVQDGDQIDVGKSSSDGTGRNDGWALFSGTSAACPQVAGVVALMRQACPRLAPAEIRQILMDTAIDITAGASNPRTGGTTAVGPDTATGHGLVDAARAVIVARLRCLTAPPAVRTPPARAVSPVVPRPSGGATRPSRPLIPIRSFLPAEVVSGMDDPTAAAGEPDGHLTAGEVEYLEELVMDGVDDLLDEL